VSAVGGWRRALVGEAWPCAALAGLAMTLVAPAPAGAVIGGRPIQASRHPGLVQVIARNGRGGRGQICGGGLIAPRVVVTAAHCLGTNPATLRQLLPLSVVSGRQRAWLYRNPPIGRTVGVDRVARAPVDPSVHQSFPDDVALLHLRRAAPFAPLSLGTVAQARADARVQVVGWGLTNANHRGGYGIRLHGLEMRVRSNTVCRRVAKSEYDAAIDLCLTPSPGAGPQGTCEGDSGTPLLSADGRSVLGVVSTGTGLCGRGASIYARVSGGPLRRWIDRKLRSWHAG
jgi:secreted trypsin-like serine protease